MTDNETPEEQPEPGVDEAVVAPEKSFSLLPVVVVISLLLALAASAGAGYSWFTGQQTQVQQSRSTSELNKKIASLQQAQQDISNASTSAQASLQLQQQEISKQLSQITDKLGRSRHDWAISEIRYTLRQANMRMQLFNDKDTALVALELADKQIARLAAPALHKLRGVVNQEIAALRAVDEIDLEGVSLQLSALAGQVKQLTVKDAGRGRQVGAVKQPPLNSETSLADWQKHADAIWSEMKTLVTIRRTDKKIIPLLGEQESQLLRQALGIKIEIARLALLQRNTKLFHTSLQEAGDWIAEYFNAEQPAVVAINTQLQALVKIQLEPVYPDISHSLMMLEAIQNGAVNPSSKPGAKAEQPAKPGSKEQQPADKPEAKAEQPAKPGSKEQQTADKPEAKAEQPAKPASKEQQAQ